MWWSEVEYSDHFLHAALPTSTLPKYLRNHATRRRKSVYNTKFCDSKAASDESTLGKNENCKKGYLTSAKKHLAWQTNSKTSKKSSKLNPQTCHVTHSWQTTVKNVHPHSE